MFNLGNADVRVSIDAADVVTVTITVPPRQVTAGSPTTAVGTGTFDRATGSFRIGAFSAIGDLHDLGIGQNRPSCQSGDCIAFTSAVGMLNATNGTVSLDLTVTALGDVAGTYVYGMGGLLQAINIPLSLG